MFSLTLPFLFKVFASRKTEREGNVFRNFFFFCFQEKVYQGLGRWLAFLTKVRTAGELKCELKGEKIGTGSAPRDVFIKAEKPSSSSEVCVCVCVFFHSLALVVLLARSCVPVWFSKC